MLHILGLRSKGKEDELETFLAKEEQFMSMASFHMHLLYCQCGSPQSGMTNCENTAVNFNISDLIRIANAKNNRATIN